MQDDKYRGRSAILIIDEKELKDSERYFCIEKLMDVLDEQRVLTVKIQIHHDKLKQYELCKFWEMIDENTFWPKTLGDK